MRISSLVTCVLLVCATVPAAAQTARNGGGANDQLMQQMQQLAAERTTLQAENSRMKRELDEVRKERDALKGTQETSAKRARASEVALAHSAQERESTAAELAKTKERTQELIGKFRETIEELRTVESDRTTVKQQLATRDTELKTCVNDNVALYKLNGEVLTRLEGQGFWSGVARAEPFTKLKRVELENLADEYRGRAEDARVPATETSPASGKPPG